MSYDEGVAMELIGMAISLPAEWWAQATAMLLSAVRDFNAFLNGA